MKLFEFERPPIVRVDIFIKGQCKTFSVDEPNAIIVRDELREMLNDIDVGFLIKQKKPIKKVAVQCWETNRNVKGITRRFTIYGLAIEEIYGILMAKLKE